MVIVEFTESCLVQKNYVFTTGSVKYVVSKGGLHETGNGSKISVYITFHCRRKFLFTLLFIAGEMKYTFVLGFFLGETTHQKI